MNLWFGTSIWQKVVILFIVSFVTMQPAEYAAGYVGRFLGLLLIVGMFQAFWPSEREEPPGEKSEEHQGHE